jgi:NAD(P)-dependent dehydrogenase (short-subunit alcohol dehydrogenase family)
LTNSRFPGTLEQTMMLVQLVGLCVTAAAAVQMCGVPDEHKQTCGFAGLTQDACEAKGCCWQQASANSDTPWCFQEMPATLTFVDSEYKGHRFQNQTAVVFGGTSGMGFATAAMLVQECAKKVVIAGRNHFQGKLAAWVLSTLSRMHCEGGASEAKPDVEYVQTDIRKRDQIRAVFNRFQGGHLHHVVNTAAIGGFIGGLMDLPDDYPLGENDAVFNNVYGAMFVTNEALKFWGLKSCNPNDDMPCPVSGVALDHGYLPSLVHVSSEQGMTPCPECDFYATSKHGIIGLTTSIANAFAGSLRANVVLPGLTDTPFSWNQVRGIELFPNRSWRQQYPLQSSWQCVKAGQVIYANCHGGGSGYGCPCEDVRPDDPRIAAIWPPPNTPMISPRQIGAAILNLQEQQSTSNGLSVVSNKQPERICQEMTKSGFPLYDLCPVEGPKIV